MWNKPRPTGQVSCIIRARTVFNLFCKLLSRESSTFNTKKSAYLFTFDERLKLYLLFIQPLIQSAWGIFPAIENCGASDEKAFSDKQQVARFSSQMSLCRTTEERRERDGALNTRWHLIAVSYLIFLFGNFVVSWPVSQYLAVVLSAAACFSHPVEWNVEAEVVFQSRGFQRSSLSRFICLRCSHLPFFDRATLLLLNIQHFSYIQNFR